jgi:hypothetical protein
LQGSFFEVEVELEAAVEVEAPRMDDRSKPL